MASIIKVDNVQNTPGTNIVSKCGTDVTVGASGDTVALACGASQTGFGRTGAVDWDTTPKVAGDSPFSATNGNGYFVNTTAGVITANLPAGSAGDIVAFSDYANTWGSNTFTISPNGAELINGGNYDVELTTNGLSVTLVYVDGTRGWKNIDDATSNVTGESAYIVASGGNTTITDGDFKIHVFTGPGTLAVTAGGTCAPCSGTGSNKVDYLVVAGAGGGGGSGGGGGGAGGMRVYMPATTPMNAPACEGARTVTATPYAITVGAGGVAAVGACGASGNPSIFSSITSTAGGKGGWYEAGCASAGGSGGGGATPGPGASPGAGNTPPVSPSQGSAGGAGPPGAHYIGGGGGGATAVGGSSGTSAGGVGGAGGYTPDAMIGPTAPSYGTPGPASSTRYFSGGGGGGGSDPNGRPGGAGGVGGGGAGVAPEPTIAGVAGTVNTGGAGGAGGPGGPPANGIGGNGGSGIVMIRYKYQN